MGFHYVIEDEVHIAAGHLQGGMTEDFLESESVGFRTKERNSEGMRRAWGEQHA